MFCANCGKWNVDGSRFCEGCGSQIYDNQPPIDPAAQEKAEDSKFVAFFKKVPVRIFLCMLLGMAVLLIGNSIVKGINGPKRTVNQYMQALKSNNWGKVYSMLDLPESTMLSKEDFIKNMKDEESDIKKFTIEDSSTDVKIPITVSDPEIFKAMTAKSMSYTVSYTTKEAIGSDDVRYMGVTVVKPEKSGLGGKYKISSEGYVGSLTVEAPEGCVVYVDGVQLFPANTEYGTDYYEAIYVFAGMHTIRITSDIFETVEEDVDVYRDTYYEPYNLQLSEDVEDDLTALLQQTLTTMWTGIFNDSDLYTLDLSMTEDAISSIEYSYESLTDWADVTDGNGMTECSFKDLTVTSMYYYMSNGAPFIEAEFSVSYHYSETWNGSTSSYDSTPYGYVDFQYVDGEWIITYMSSRLMNY